VIYAADSNLITRNLHIDEYAVSGASLFICAAAAEKLFAIHAACFHVAVLHANMRLLVAHKGLCPLIMQNSSDLWEIISFGCYKRMDFQPDGGI
jgi:hypothetical protein